MRTVKTHWSRFDLFKGVSQVTDSMVGCVIVIILTAISSQHHLSAALKYDLN